jgi:hypothetical protein
VPLGIGGTRFEEDVLIGVAADEVGGASTYSTLGAVRVDWCSRAARDRCEQYAYSVVLGQELMVRDGGGQSWRSGVFSGRPVARTAAGAGTGAVVKRGRSPSR